MTIRPRPTQDNSAGSILSPTLLNMDLKMLVEQLEHVPDLYHNAYADHITLCATRGSPAYIKETLQHAINALNLYTTNVGRSFTPEKSDYSEIINSRKLQTNKPRYITPQ